MSPWIQIYLIACLGFALQFQASEAGVPREEAETRPPMLSRIVRVSRGPTIPSSMEEATLRLKSPVYQLRFRPNRLSHFHSYATMSGGQNGNPGTSIFNNLPQGQAIHPPQHHGPGHALSSMAVQASNSNSEDEESGISEEEQPPTFTPFIGARALSNMGKFFEHLRENIEALKGTESDAELEERLLAGNKDGDEFKGLDWDWDESSEFPSDFPYQHFNEANTASAPLTIKWQPPASGFLHRNNRVSSSHFIGGDPEFKRPKFNPSWVKMGLGKRR